MLLKSYILFVFSASCLASAFFVIWTKNPVFSVLFLILSFFNIIALLFLFGFEFLAVTILIVYVGAVAVLFLFVLLMLNIKLAELIDDYNNIIPVGAFICFFFIYQLIFLFSFSIESIGILDQTTIAFILDYSNLNMLEKTDFLQLNSVFSNIKNLAIVFYSEFLVHFLIAGLILLLAMIAAIVLTLNKQFGVKNQNVYSQVLKDYNHALVYLN